jgi:hypothetical protein
MSQNAIDNRLKENNLKALKNGRFPESRGWLIFQPFFMVIVFSKLSLEIHLLIIHTFNEF